MLTLWKWRSQLGAYKLDGDRWRCFGSEISGTIDAGIGALSFMITRVISI